MINPSSFQQPIRQLEPRRGSYYYLIIPKETVSEFSRKQKTRLICNIEDKVSYQCGLNHLGDGHFFVILAKKYLKKLGKDIGDNVSFIIHEDPNPLGVEIPEVLQVYLAQESWGSEVFEKITDGKKRALIFSILPIKNIDLQVKKISDFLTQEAQKLQSKKKS